MRVHVMIEQMNVKVDETVTGANADEVVGAIKKRVSSEVGFPMRMIIHSMANLAFAQEVVRRYNQLNTKSAPIPNSCQEFLEMAQTQGFVKIEEP